MSTSPNRPAEEDPRVLIAYRAPHRGDALLRVLRARFPSTRSCTVAEAEEALADTEAVPAVVVCDDLTEESYLRLQAASAAADVAPRCVVLSETPHPSQLEGGKPPVFAFLRPNWLPHEVDALVARAAEAWSHERRLEALSQANHRQQSELSRVVAERTAELESNRRTLAATNAQLRRKAAEVEEANRKLKRIASTDGLTGLYNHRYFQVQWRREVTLAQRYGDRLSLLVLDVDHFKNFNDSVGHPAGDGLLRELARLLVGSVRAVDLVARYGGEEFVIMLPRTGKDAAVLLADRIRRAVEARPFAHGEVQPGGRVTVSVGVASFPEDGSSPSELLSRADRAMYRAKGLGRNAVQAASAEDEPDGHPGNSSGENERMEAERRELEELIGEDEESG